MLHLSDALNERFEPLHDRRIVHAMIRKHSAVLMFVCCDMV
jgi:hypothetical protein